MIVSKLCRSMTGLGGIAILVTLLGCGLRESAVADPKEENRKQAADAIFEKRHQLDKLYLTERTRKRIIRSGKVSVPFVDQEAGELCWPALTCVNPQCPGKGQDGFPYLFVHSDPLIKVGSDGLPAYPQIPAGQDYAQMVADAGGFPDAACPACYEKFRRGKSETPEEKDRYAGYVVEYELRESADQRGELDRQALALHTTTTSQSVGTPTSSPAVEPSSSAPPSAAAGSEEEQRAAALASQITRPLLKGGVQPETAELLRKVLKTTQDPQVRVAIISGLGKARDPDSVPQFLDAMADDSPEIRKQAGAALERTCGFPHLFNPDASLAQRQEVITRYRTLWNTIVNTPGQPYIRMMKDPAFKEDRARQAMEQLKQYQSGPN